MKRTYQALIVFFSIVIYCFPSKAEVPLSEQRSATTTPAAADNQTLTLFDCYKLALKQSETIVINKEVIKEAEAHFMQALSTILPHVSFVNNQKWQGAASASGPADTFERKFVFTQTLFSGFKEVAAITGSELEKSQRINEEKRAEQLLFADVSDAFYLLIEQREDLKILQSITGVLVDRIKYLLQREQLGRSRRSEIVTTQAQLLGIYAQIEAAKNQEAVARHLLEFLVGRTVGEIVDKGNPFPDIRPEIFYLSKAALRPDVLAAEKAWELSKKIIIVAKSGLLPSISAQGDYYAQRTTSPQDSKWDAQLSVNIPIFEGTETLGNIKQANAQAKENEMQLRLASRQTFQQIRDAYINCQIAVSRAGTLGRALRAAEASYFLQRQDYRRNVVNNLDVLAAIQTLEGDRRSFVQSLYETKRLHWQLKIAAGESPVEE